MIILSGSVLLWKFRKILKDESLILTRFAGIISCLLFNAAWALILCIYISTVKARCKLYALSLQQGIPYEQFVVLAQSKTASASQQPQYRYNDHQKDTSGT